MESFLANTLSNIAGGLFLRFFKKDSRSEKKVFNSQSIVVSGEINSGRDTIIKLVRSKKNKKKSNIFSKITPISIKEELANTPPFQRDEKCEFYKGLKVKWGLTFESVHKLQDGKVHVSTAYKDYILPDVSFDLDVKTFPEIKIMHKGTKLLVEGIISDVWRGSYITLEHTKITKL